MEACFAAKVPKSKILKEFCRKREKVVSFNRISFDQMMTIFLIGETNLEPDPYCSRIPFQWKRKLIFICTFGIKDLKFAAAYLIFPMKPSPMDIAQLH